MKKIPSFHHLQEHVSLFLTVIQLSIIIFVFIPPINAQTTLIPISEPNDWTKLIDFLPNAKMAGQSIWISLLPPSKTPPICKTCNYSEPYRLDFISWAKEIANLSLRYSNLTGYTIEDLQENLNLGYVKQTYIDSIITAGKSINPRLQFITTLPNIYYVDKNATGNGSGSSWTNAATSVSLLNWTNITGGDTIYVSGGTDSLTYDKTALSNLTPSSIVVVTKGKDAGHNGKVIFSTTTATGVLCTFELSNCTNIKLTGLTFKWELTTQGNEALYLVGGTNLCYVDNCHIVTNGYAQCIALNTTTHISITNNIIESLTNTRTEEQDGIEFFSGGGGHTITGNTITLRGTAAGSHRDGIQYGQSEGGSNNYETIIANNFVQNIQGGYAGNSGMLFTSMYSNRFLIYNNIITLLFSGASGITLRPDVGDTAYNVSARLYNNTIITSGNYSCPFGAGYVDTLIVKNNIFIDDSIGYGIVQFLGLKYKDFDYNQYQRKGYPTRIDTNYTEGYNYTWAQWQAKGNDVHSDTGMVSFANIWETNIADYAPKTGFPVINGGVDLSAYFTTDIRGVTRPLGAAWDRGAVESK